ncbi:MAG: formylglycine-generating enzyme family protein [Syntrophales bacterium]
MLNKMFVLMLIALSLTMVCLVPCSIAREQGINTFTSPTLSAKFVLIPAGTFMMGSPSDEPGRDRDEDPQHQVTISRPFYMQTTEVTQWQWKRVMGNNPSHFSSCGGDCPVEQVSWEDVQGFIQKLNSMEGTDKYRLPTEAQWEYAARAGTTTRFHAGNSDDDLSRAGWLKANCGSKTHQVGQKASSSWGLYDMHGNVYEWVQDWFRLYSAVSVTDPAGPSSGLKRVRRGGSWSSIARFCRSANRDYFGPDQHSGLLGFRLLRIQ